ncbi:MAG: hypothetical protein KDE53_31760 [Caldilineaceae bacterium]|nr:hypothetical protein [Caldilineaceae bacterium]
MVNSMLQRGSHHPRALPKRPQGQETRGKTARNRLRRVDNFVALYDPALLQRSTHDYTQSYFVDLGYGAEPFTTLESAARLRRLNPTLPVLGVEIDATRVTAALPYADSLTHFRLGGFNLPLQAGEHVRLVRAFNVLRQYEESAVADAYAMLAQQVVPGGLLIEGTSDPFGRLWVAHVMRRQPTAPSWLHEATVFSTNFRTGFDPSEFQAILPKDLIHRMVPGEPIYDFFQAWKRATLESIGAKTWGVRQWFATSAQGLAARGYRVDLRHRWLKRGYLLWLRPTALFGARDA